LRNELLIRGTPLIFNPRSKTNEMKRLVVIFMGFLFLMGACSSPKPISELTDADIEMSIERGPCFGKCPVYKMDIYQGGYAVFYGTRFAKKLGKHSKQLDKKTYKELVKKFKSSKFFDFKDEYESLIVDLASVSISYQEKGKRKTVTGKEDRPTKIMELQYALEKIAESDGWTLLEAAKEDSNLTIEAPKAEPEPVEIKTEIIIQPGPNTKLPIWFRENEKYGLRLIRRISQEENLWLITYDTKNYQPEQMLNILKEDKALNSAQFNKNIEPRN